MTVELRMLAASGVLALLLALITIAVHFRRFGGTMIRSNREPYPPLDGVAGRVVRAQSNLSEALPPFAIAVLCVTLLHRENGWTDAAACVFLGARFAHATLYIAGVPEVRSIAFYLGLGATALIFGQLPLL